MKRFRNGKHDNDFGGSAYSRVNRMISGESSGQLASHTGHGYTSYTFMVEDRSKKARQNFTSAGTRHVFQVTREGKHWHIVRNSGDIRGSIIPTSGGDEMHLNDGRSFDFKTLREARKKAKILPQKAVSNLKSILGDYKAHGRGHGGSGHSGG